MLELVIWGIAAMLLVKALDILHQHSISRASGEPGSIVLATLGAFIGLVAAVVLVILVNRQPNPFSWLNNAASAENSNQSDEVASSLSALSVESAAASADSVMKENEK